MENLDAWIQKEPPENDDPPCCENCSQERWDACIDNHGERTCPEYQKAIMERNEIIQAMEKRLGIGGENEK